MCVRACVRVAEVFVRLGSESSLLPNWFVTFRNNAEVPKRQGSTVQWRGVASDCVSLTTVTWVSVPALPWLAF